MLGRLRENQQTFVVGDNGVAVIKLDSASGGEALLTVMLKDKRLTLRPWIRAANQPWVVVGFAEGTLAHSKISNAIKDSVGGGDLVDSGGRVAFFAKGSISGDLLCDYCLRHACNQASGSSHIQLDGRSAIDGRGNFAGCVPGVR